MKYNFNSIENLVLVRSTLRKFLKKISDFHSTILVQTPINNIPFKLKEFLDFLKDYQNSGEYKLLCQYIHSVHCPNFFNEIDNEFYKALSKKNYNIQDILSILKKISLIRSEIEPEIININEKYF